MGMVEDIEQQQQQEPSFKPFCKVCKRGFGCAEALGGHMRSHAVGDVHFHQSSHDQEIGKNNFMKSRPEGGSKENSYFLQTNTNRSTSYRVSEDLQYRPAKFAPPLSSSESEVEEMMIKSTRAKSQNYEDQHCSSEEEDLANCLVMLSNKSFVLSDKVEEYKVKQVEKCTFQCKACKKVFNSHQALGGHGASHKKVKGCYAVRFNNNLNEDEYMEDDFINQHEELSAPSDKSSETELDLGFSLHHQLPNRTILSKRKFKAHQCSICQRVFSSGQALGGHKRCHWPNSNQPDHTILRNLHGFQFDSQKLFKKPMLKKSEPPPLDLNFPPRLNNINAVNNIGTNSTNPFNNEAQGRTFWQLWGNDKVHDNNRDNQQQYYTKSVVHSPLHDSNNSTTSEDNCRMKQIAKLNYLKDMNLDGGSSRWLQVGIASTTDIIATPRSDC